MSSDNVETRTRILNATLELLETETGSNIRMSDIAKASGISRQAVYLHFSSCADLWTATTRHLDKVKGIEERLAVSRNATSGKARLSAFIDVWGGYIPEIYSVAKALLEMKDTDEDAAFAWNDRMQAVRDGCAAAVEALAKDADLASDLSSTQATDILWTMLSVRNWEHLTKECGWQQRDYIAHMQRMSLLVLTKV